MRTEPGRLEPQQLRTFALTTGGLFAAVFGLLLPWCLNLRWPIWPWLVFLGLGAWGLVHPASLRHVHTAWKTLAQALGEINNRVILGLLFYLLITPAGWLRRLVGGDTMARQNDTDRVTYRKPKVRRTPKSLEGPF